MTNAESSLASQGIDEFLGLPPPGKPSQIRRWGIAVVTLALLLLVLAYIFNGGATAPEYATVELQRADMTVYVTATGNLEPTNEVSVGSELSGLIDAVFVDINDKVKKNLARQDHAVHG